MFKRMLFKMMFKVSVGLGLMLGIASYAQYLSGGDPASVWRRVGSGAVASVGNSVGGLRERLGNAVDGAGSLSAGWTGEGDVPTELPGDVGGMTRVWTWQDSSGVTHFSNSPPVGQASTHLVVDPNVNVLAPVVDTGRQAADEGDPENGTGRSATSSGAGVAAHSDTDLQQPGIAGAMRRARGDGPAPDPARAEALLKLLQNAY